MGSGSLSPWNSDHAAGPDPTRGNEPDPFFRDTYRRLFASMGTHGIDALRLHTQQQKPWGSERFRRQIEGLAQRSMEVRPRGRPRYNLGK